MIYIAAPFFNPEQLEIVERIKEICEERSVSYFSPKDECMFGVDANTPEEVFDLNIRALNKVEMAIVVTNGKDVGTMFEAGYCYASEIPILYLWLNPPDGAKFNLMLAASGSVCTSYAALAHALNKWADGQELKSNYGEGSDDLRYE